MFAKTKMQKRSLQNVRLVLFETLINLCFIFSLILNIISVILLSANNVVKAGPPLAKLSGSAHESDLGLQRQTTYNIRHLVVISSSS